MRRKGVRTIAGILCGHTRLGETRKSLQALIGATLLLLTAANAASEDRPAAGKRICDVEGDFFLGVEDYPTAIRLHQEIVGRDPGNAPALYHLGFAPGMNGRHREEMAEYRRAVEPGLTDRARFLNLELAYLEQGSPNSAVHALMMAVLTSHERPELHDDLALAYDRLRMLGAAQQRALTALAPDPDDPDTRNTVALLPAERGDYARARLGWSSLLSDNPAYRPAKPNPRRLLPADLHRARSHAVECVGKG